MLQEFGLFSWTYWKSKLNLFCNILNHFVAGLVFCLVVVVEWLLSTTTSKALRFGLQAAFRFICLTRSGCAGCLGYFGIL
jgi:hypothetical protein